MRGGGDPPLEQGAAGSGRGHGGSGSGSGARGEWSEAWKLRRLKERCAAGISTVPCDSSSYLNLCYMLHTWHPPPNLLAVLACRIAGAGAAWHAPSDAWAWALLHAANGLLMVGWLGCICWLAAKCVEW